VKRLGEGEGGIAERKSQPKSYELAGSEQPAHQRPALFTPSPAATGPLDIAFADEFGYVRLGAETEEVEYRDKKGKKRTFPIAPTDVYVPKEMIDAYHLKQGDRVACTWRRAIGNERFPSVVEIQAVNGKPLRGRQK